MIKRVATFFVYMLLATLPMQSIAAANLPLLQGMLQSELHTSATKMPCHEHMAKVSTADASHKSSNSKQSCNKSCASLCQALSSLNMIVPSAELSAYFSRPIQTAAAEVIYASVIPPNLLRPPISLS
jgi:hypothetical protein